MKNLIKPKVKINRLYIVGVVVVAAFIIGGIFSYRWWVSRDAGNDQITRGICLSNDEIVTYKIEKKSNRQGVAIISVIKKATGRGIFEFQIDLIEPGHYHLLEMHRCGVYIIRRFNYDPGKTKQAPGYREELWRYNYNGNGESLILLAEKPEEFIAYFSMDFRVDSLERYVVLERSYLGQPDYALVVKDLKTLNDIFVLTLNDMKKINPEIESGSINLGKWTPDGKYLGGTLFQGALDTAYFNIEAGTWKAEVFVPPLDIPSGAERATSFAGYIAYADFPTFFGIDIIAEQEQEQFQKEGREKHLYLYNLRTKEKLLLTTTKDPAQRFEINWLSDTELEYTLPTGERKIYKLEE